MVGNLLRGFSLYVRAIPLAGDSTSLIVIDAAKLASRTTSVAAKANGAL